MLHSGALERRGQALILPALPGSGKSTLTAALAYRGWRLLSDEFGLIEPESGLIRPIPRAVPLKNRSIPVIRDYLPEAHLGPVFPKTRKGEVSHLRPPLESIERQGERARPRWVCFPRFIEGLPGRRLARLDRSLAFTRLAQNAFNYRLLAETGFAALAALVRGCDCFSLEYGDLDQALAGIAELSGDEA
jgi:HprK-related kinase A